MDEGTKVTIVAALIGGLAAIISAIINNISDIINIIRNSKNKKLDKKTRTKSGAHRLKIDRKKAIFTGLVALIVSGSSFYFFRTFATKPIPLFLDGVEYTDSKNLCDIEAEDIFVPGKKNTISIKVDNTDSDGYCSWVLPLQNMDVSEKTSLSFWVKGENGDEHFLIGICDSTTYNGQEPKIEEIATTRWRKITIPLEEFSNQNLSSVENLSIGFEDIGDVNILLSDFYFEP